MKKRIGSFTEKIGIMMGLSLVGSMVFSPTVASGSRSTRNGEIT